MEVNSGIPRGGAHEILDGPLKDAEEKPVPLRSLLTRQVVISIANYGMLGLLEMMVTTLLPLIWSTSVEFGGLGMTPASIGLWMAGYGSLNGILQFVAFPHIVGRFGPRRVFIAGIAAFAPVYLMFPFENLSLRHAGSGANVIPWVLVVLQLGLISISDLGFGKFFANSQFMHHTEDGWNSLGSVFMYVCSAAPNRRSLGATNGLAQTMVSVQRTVAPAAAASLFAFSVKNDVLGGHLTYVVLLAAVCGGLCVAVQLPKTIWK